MNSKERRTSMVLFVLSLSLLAGGTLSAQSRYAEIKNGVGNVLVGEVLPYDDDDGYRNVVTDQVSLSDLRAWKSFYYRAYFAKKIGDINHDVRVLVMNFKGIGGNSSGFEKDVGGNVMTWTFKEEDPAGYGERTEWSRYFPDFRLRGASFTYFLKPYDCSKPDSFEFGCGEDDIAGKMELSVANLAKWKKAYGLDEIEVTMQVFAFTDGGSEWSAETRTVVEVEENLSGGYDVSSDEEISKINSVRKWENRQLLARGAFRIILD